jgi:hypothetical protein
MTAKAIPSNDQRTSSLPSATTAATVTPVDDRTGDAPATVTLPAEPTMILI